MINLILFQIISEYLDKIKGIYFSKHMNYSSLLFCSLSFKPKVFYYPLKNCCISALNFSKPWNALTSFHCKIIFIFQKQNYFQNKYISQEIFFSTYILANNWYLPSIALQKKKMIFYYIDYQVKNVFKNLLKISFLISFTMCLMCLIWVITSSTQERQKQLSWWFPWHTYAWKESWCMNKNTSRSPSWPSFRLSFSLKSKLWCFLSYKDNWEVKTCCSHKA